MIKEIRTITPDIAKAYLVGHINKRPLSQEMVEEMKADIEAGIFNKDDANICFDTDDKFYYGQHILNAIIQLNKEIELNEYHLETTDSRKEMSLGYLNRQSKYKYYNIPQIILNKNLNKTN